MSRTVQNAISTALSNGPQRNAVTGEDARAIAAAASADGKVTRQEVKAVTDLNLGPTFFNDDMFQTRDWNLSKPTASIEGFHVLNEFLKANSVEHAVSAALSEGTGAFNFVDSQDAKNIIAAANADGRIDAGERKALQDLAMGWTYHADEDGAAGNDWFEKPTLSMPAGSLIHAALKTNE